MTTATHPSAAPAPTEPNAGSTVEDDFTRTPTGVDLTVAAQLARGHRRREWLMLLLSPGVGLEPEDTTRYRTKRAERVDEFVNRLSDAGYQIEEVAVGHRPRPRRLITGFSAPGAR